MNKHQLIRHQDKGYVSKRWALVASLHQSTTWPYMGHRAVLPLGLSMGRTRQNLLNRHKIKIIKCTIKLRSSKIEQHQRESHMFPTKTYVVRNFTDPCHSPSITFQIQWNDAEKRRGNCFKWKVNSTFIRNNFQAVLGVKRYTSKYISCHTPSEPLSGSWTIRGPFYYPKC